MKAKFHPVNTDDVQMTLEMTMPMSAWKFIYRHVTPLCGTSEFRNVLDAMIEKAEKNFSHEGIHDSE